MGDLSPKAKEIEAKIFAIAGEEFNLNSPKQLATILFEKLGLAPKAKKEALCKNTQYPFFIYDFTKSSKSEIRRKKQGD